MKKKFNGKIYDTDNIPGTVLAEIGREVLGNSYVQKEFKARLDVIDYESLNWLDDRIYDICEKGRI